MRIIGQLTKICSHRFLCFCLLWSFWVELMHNATPALLKLALQLALHASRKKRVTFEYSHKVFFDMNSTNQYVQCTGSGLDLTSFATCNSGICDPNAVGAVPCSDSLVEVCVTQTIQTVAPITTTPTTTTSKHSSFWMSYRTNNSVLMLHKISADNAISNLNCESKGNVASICNSQENS